MMNVTILAVGKLKERYFAEACAEYSKRLGAYCKMAVVEVDEYRLPQNPSQAEIDKCIQAEGESLLRRLPKSCKTVALCIEGQSLSSRQLAAKIDGFAASASHIAFVIGGSHGLADCVKKVADLRFSMSALTFPHQLARVLLLEQIYRGFSILGGGKYHK